MPSPRPFRPLPRADDSISSTSDNADARSRFRFTRTIVRMALATLARVARADGPTLRKSVARARARPDASRGTPTTRPPRATDRARQSNGENISRRARVRERARAVARARASASAPTRAKTRSMSQRASCGRRRDAREVEDAVRTRARGRNEYLAATGRAFDVAGRALGGETRRDGDGRYGRGLHANAIGEAPRGDPSRARRRDEGTGMTSRERARASARATGARRRARGRMVMVSDHRYG